VQRVVQSEWLDELPPEDAGAVQSRRDLRRLNFLMGHVGMMTRALAGPWGRQKVRSIVELGAGDGTFLLKLARQLERLEAGRLLIRAMGNAGAWLAWRGRIPRLESIPTKAVLVDRQKLVRTVIREKFGRLGWRVEIVKADVFDWLAEPRLATGTMMVANLFLHHFAEETLRSLLLHISARSDFFVACEPRRSAFALSASRKLGVIGCNAVTRHDAVVSVQAGFVDRELSALWPATPGWQLEEREAGMFSHCFVARREPDA